MLRINDAIIEPNYIASPIEYTVNVWQAYGKLIYEMPNNWLTICFAWNKTQSADVYDKKNTRF